MNRAEKEEGVLPSVLSCHRAKNGPGSRDVLGLVSVHNFSEENQDIFIYPTDSDSLQLTKGRTKPKEFIPYMICIFMSFYNCINITMLTSWSDHSVFSNSCCLSFTLSFVSSGRPMKKRMLRYGSLKEHVIPLSPVCCDI